ncbi:MAG: cytosine permease [Woeseiaceae bacterium]|nr:cytosine permease [Woeseiaceae bacterium]
MSAAPGQDSVFSRLPLRLGEREYGNRTAHATCFAYAIATWCFLVGSYTADLVGAVEGTVALIAGNLIGVFLTTMPLSLGCQRYGLEQMDFCKSAFGQHGSHVVLVFYLINMLGWSGLLLVMFGNGIFNIGNALDLQPGEWVVGTGVAVGIVLAFIVVLKGVDRLGTVNNIVTPLLGLVVIYMLYMLFTVHGVDAVLDAEPLDPGPDPWVNYAIAFELGIANGFSWWGGIGFIARNTTTRRAATYPQVLQLGLSSGIVSSIALYSALVVGSDDPTRWMVPLGGVALGMIALAFVALANVTSTGVSLFASGLALRHVPGLKRRPWWQILVITIIPCCFFIFWSEELYSMGDAFLAYNGTMYAPISGILFVDFFFLRQQRICLKSIFDNSAAGAYHYWKGFNPLALGCVLLGQATYFALYDPFTGEAHWLFVYLPASLAAFAVPALVYWAGMRIFGVRLEMPAREARDGKGGLLEQPNI